MASAADRSANDVVRRPARRDRAARVVQAERMALGTSALFITGPPGSGKTALAKEISEVLWRAREPHAVVDLDELCRGLLPGDTAAGFHVGLAAENLATVWSSFRRRGARRLVVARILESAEELAVVGAAVPDCTFTVCRLVVEAETLHRRLRHREAGSSVELLSSVTERSATTMDQLDLPGFTVRNPDGESISAVAADVVTSLGWPAAPVALG
jgi:hypothetical protein